jgi:hypothetical protein
MKGYQRVVNIPLKTAKRNQRAVPKIANKARCIGLAIRRAPRG